MEGIKCVLLDIEGTICPISFVKDVLFPYALNGLPAVLASKWDDEEFKQYRDAFPDTARGSPEEFQAHVEDLTKRDVKVAYLKNLQGYLWENGYKTGAYSTPLFPDVTPQLKQWNSEGLQLAIYSSGSVFAQKLLFGHVNVEDHVIGQKRKRQLESNGEDVDESTERPSKMRVTTSNQTGEDGLTIDVADQSSYDKAADDHPEDEPNGKLNKEEYRKSETTEDIQYLMTDWFDTTNAGPKTEASSYEKIAGALKCSPSEMLFLTDNVKELDAAVAAGMRSLLVDRPGNAPLSETDKDRLSIVTSLDDISLRQNTANGDTKSSRTEKPNRRQSQRLKAKKSERT